MQSARKKASRRHFGARLDTSRLAGEYATAYKVHLMDYALQKLSSISKQLSDKLATFLRDSLGMLYAAVPVPALRLAAAVFESIYHNRILSAIGGAQSEQKELWESVLHALLSGVLVRPKSDIAPEALALSWGLAGFLRCA